MLAMLDAEAKMAEPGSSELARQIVADRKREYEDAQRRRDDFESKLRAEYGPLPDRR